MLTSIGGMLEYYDFVIFSLFAIVLGKTFFPSEGSEALQTLSAFTVFAVGYLARPLGGIIFGHIGDIYGRKKSFILTILLMGSSSFLIALLPSYNTAGIITVIVFVLLRIIQGAAIGGEIPSAVVFIKETLTKNSGLACGMIFCLINFGILFAQVTKILLGYFLEDQYAWRAAFILGGLAAILSYFFRKEIHETEVFLSSKKTKKLPLLVLFKTQKLAIIRSSAVISIIAIIVGFYSLFLPSYMILNHILDSSTLILLNLLIFSLMCIPSGILADKYNPLSVFVLGSVGVLIFGAIFYLCIISNSQYLIYIMCINSCFMGLTVGVAANYSCTLFDANVRASGLGTIYNICFAIFNGIFLALASYGIASGIIFTPIYLSSTIIFISLVVLISTPKK